MNRNPLVTVDGLRIEIDGQEVLLIKTPIPATNKAVDFDKPIEQLMRLQNQIPVVFVAPKPDGTLTAIVPGEWKDKLRARTILASQLTKIPIYEDDLG